MADTKQNDDDLIILTDDIQTDSTEIVVNLDEEKNTSQEDDLVLTFDESEKKDEIEKNDNTSLEIEEDPFEISQTNETPLIELDSSENDLNFNDLTQNTDNVDEHQIEASKIKEEDSTDVLDFSSMGDEKEEKGQEVVGKVEENIDFEEEIDTSIGTMESILDDTISKLEKRQEVIHSQEEKQELAISHLEEEIKQLEEEKKEALKKKLELETEDKKIKVNITQLDKMKASAEVKTISKK